MSAPSVNGKPTRPEPGAQPDAGSIERDIRGRLYQELDLLAYAFEMEAAREVEEGRDEDAARTQQTRLGIRLAQRLVGGVTAPEVDRRLDAWRTEYLAKFPPDPTTCWTSIAVYG